MVLPWGVLSCPCDCWSPLAWVSSSGHGAGRAAWALQLCRVSCNQEGVVSAVAPRSVGGGYNISSPVGPGFNSLIGPQGSRMCGRGCLCPRRSWLPVYLMSCGLGFPGGQEGGSPGRLQFHPLCSYLEVVPFRVLCLDCSRLSDGGREKPRAAPPVPDPMQGLSLGLKMRPSLGWPLQANSSA